MKSKSSMIFKMNGMQNLDSNYITTDRVRKLKIKFLFLNNCLEVSFCILTIVLNNNISQRRPNDLFRERIPKFFLEKGQF